MEGKQIEEIREFFHSIGKRNYIYGKIPKGIKLHYKELNEFVVVYCLGKWTFYQLINKDTIIK